MPLFGRKKTDDVPVRATPAYAPLPEPPAPGPDGLRTLEQHRDYLLSCVTELPPFRQHVLDALGLSICEDVVSGIGLPRFDNSAMDGYAVRAADVARRQRRRPGPPARGRGGRGRVGAAAPALPRYRDEDHDRRAGAAGRRRDRPLRDTDRGSADVTVIGPSEVGQHIRRAGEDVEAGASCSAWATQLGPRDVGLLAAIGLDKVLVRPRPRVVVISTGSELVDPGLAARARQQIYDSNSYLLAAAAKAAGAQVFRVGQVGDDPDQVKQVITDQLIRADLILTTGGVSQGDYDVVKAGAARARADRLRQRGDAAGQAAGLRADRRGPVPIIMLPGNPVSAFVSFEVFVRPVIRKLMGATPYVRADGPLPRRARHGLDPGQAPVGPRRTSSSTRTAPAGGPGRRPRLAPARRPGPGQRPGRPARRTPISSRRRRARGLAAGRPR